MKAGVPIATPAPVSVAPELPESALAMPKSVTITRPRAPSSRMLSGLMSRWMIESACAAPSASADSAMIRRTSSTGSLPRRRMRLATDSPSTYPMTKYTRPCPSPTVWIGTMWGWLSLAAVWASRVKRSRMSDWKASSGGSTLMATRRWSRSSRARYTTPIPPRPTSPSMV